MNLGLDIDGVLTNIEEYQFKYGIPYFKKHFNKDVINEYALDVKDIFGATEEEYKKFWSKYIIPYAITCSARKGAAEYTEWAYENGHKVYRNKITVPRWFFILIWTLLPFCGGISVFLVPMIIHFFWDYDWHFHYDCKLTRWLLEEI